MTIKPVHVEQALTLEQHRALELRRPLTDKPIGSTTGARRSNDEAASRAWDEPDRPAVTSRRRTVGPRGNPDNDRQWAPRAGISAQNAVRAAIRATGGVGTPETVHGRTDAPSGTGVPR